MKGKRWSLSLVVLLIATLGLFIFSSPGSQVLTLPDILSSAFPSSLIVAPAGDVVA